MMITTLCILINSMFAIVYYIIWMQIVCIVTIGVNINYFMLIINPLLTLSFLHIPVDKLLKCQFIMLELKKNVNLLSVCYLSLDHYHRKLKEKNESSLKTSWQADSFNYLHVLKANNLLLNFLILKYSMRKPNCVLD